MTVAIGDTYGDYVRGGNGGGGHGCGWGDRQDGGHCPLDKDVIKKM